MKGVERECGSRVSDSYGRRAVSCVGFLPLSLDLPVAQEERTPLELVTESTVFRY